MTDRQPPDGERAHRCDGSRADSHRALFEHSDDAIAYVTLDEQCTIRDVNPRFVAEFGCNRDAVAGESLREVVGEAADPVKRAQTDETPFGWTEVHRTTDEGTKTFEYQFVSDSDDSNAGYAVYRRITDASGRGDTRSETERYRERLYEITSDSARSDDEKIRRLLELGCEYLDIENGHVVKIDEETGRHEIVRAYGSDLVEAGAVTALEETYCRKTIQSDDILSVYNAPEQGWEDDPAYEKWNIGCYVGGKVLVSGELYGTVCFANESPRDAPFTVEEKTFMDLLTRWVSHLYERQEREQELQQSNRQLGAIIESSPDAILTRALDGTVKRWNPAAERIFGWTEAEAVGETRPVVPDDQREEHEHILDQLRQGKRLTDIETKRLTKAGNQIDVSLSAAPLRDEDDTIVGITEVLEDITERKEHEREVRERERELSTLMDNIPGMVYRCRNKRGWPMEFVSDGTEAVTGYEVSALEDGPVSYGEDIVVAEDREVVWNDVQTAIEAGEPFEVTYRIERADGQTRWVWERGRGVFADDGDLDALEGVILDVTDRKEYEQELEATKDRLAEQNRTLRRLYEISADREIPFEEKIKQLLDLGRERLGTSGGFISSIDEDTDQFEFVYTSGTGENLSPGTVAPLSETYCRKAVATDEVFEVANAPGEGWVDDPAYERWGFDQYIGGAVRVEGELEGTLGFVDKEAAPGTHTDEARAFVSLATQWVSYELERRRREQRLERYKEYTDDILDAIDDVFYVLDEEGAVQRWNDSLSDVTGYTDAEIAEMYGPDFFDEEHAGDIAAAIEEVFETGSTRIEAPLLTNDGERIPYEFIPSRVVDPDGNRRLAGIGRDISDRQEYEQSLNSLHDMALELLTTESEQAVADLVVDAGADVIGTPAVGLYLLDDETNELAPTAFTTEFFEHCDGMPTATASDDAPLWSTFVSDSMTVITGADDQSHFVDGDDERGVVVPVGEHGVLVVLTASVSDNLQQLVETLAATTAAAFNRIDSEAELRQRDELLQARNERLQRQIQINGIIRSIDQSLIDATNRADVESTVCERLVEDDNIAFAWVGALDASEERLEPRAWAGDCERYLDALDLSGGSTEPSWRTAMSEETTVVANIGHRLQAESWPADALAENLQSVVSVPLVFDEYTYGVLSVYADNPDAFGDLEHSVFTELGENIAHSMNTIETRQALYSETVLEVELSVDSEETFLGRIAIEAGCEVNFEGLGAIDEDGARIFFRTTGVESAAVEAILDELHAVTAYNIVTDSDEECIFEATVNGTLLVAKLVRHGGRPRSLSADANGVSVTADLPQTTDVRGFVEMLEGRYPSVELSTLRDVERTKTTGMEQSSAVLEGLTDRQREVLRTAYLAGYFEEPRETSAKEVAEMLSVSQPTVSHHLRKGEKRLFEQLFDDARMAIT